MSKPGRIPCLNPRCNRTAAQEKHGNAREIVCYQCWRLTPKDLRDRYRSVRKRAKKVAGLVEKRVKNGADSVEYDNILDRIWTEFDENWDKIRRYWQLPDENQPPEGIDDFLKEIGLAG